MRSTGILHGKDAGSFYLSDISGGVSSVSVKLPPTTVGLK